MKMKITESERKFELEVRILRERSDVAGVADD